MTVQTTNLSYPHHRQTGFLLSAETEKPLALAQLTLPGSKTDPFCIKPLRVTYTLTQAHEHPRVHTTPHSAT